MLVKDPVLVAMSNSNWVISEHNNLVFPRQKNNITDVSLTSMKTEHFDVFK